MRLHQYCIQNRKNNNYLSINQIDNTHQQTIKRNNIMIVQSIFQYTIYRQDMNSEHNDRVSLIKIASIVKAGAALNKWKKLANRSKDRYYRFRQLVLTEQDYQKDLISIIQKIEKPLKDKGCINGDDAVKMFPNVQSMIGLSMQLQEQLKKKYQEWNRRQTMIGQTMIRFSKFLLVYSDFFKNFNQTQIKLKTILITNPEAKIIEKALSTQTRIITFEDLMSKPFQRPLKYHLILRDYASKIQKTHKDYPFLQEAIQCYHKVNQQNNLSLQNKEKDQMLMILDAKFGYIIESQARYFVKQYETIVIDTAYDMYILSDMVILAFKGANKEYMRIYMDKFSYVERPPDGNFFTNRLFLYGKSLCVHLSFLEVASCNQVYTILKKLIEQTNEKQTSRQQMINMRTTRNSIIQRRRSFTNLQPQFKRPMVVRIVGCQKRFLSIEKTVVYFILEFHSTSPKFDDPTEPHQISYVTIDTLMLIQNLGRMLYKVEQSLGVFCISNRPKNVTDYQYKKNEDKRLQIQCLYIQLFLNTLFRNDKVLKRIDFVSYLLKLSEPLWLHLNDKYQCLCKSCTNNKVYQCYQDYFKELTERYLVLNKTEKDIYGRLKKKTFCDIKTITMQQSLCSIPARQLREGNASQREKIIWVKSKLGWVNHAFATPKPQTQKNTILIYICNVNSNDNIPVEIYPSFRVKQIVDSVAKRLNMNLEDYTLSMVVNGKNCLLFDDEIIGDIIIPPKEQDSFFNFKIFKPAYFPITLYLKKIWCLQHEIEFRQEQQKLMFEVEQIIFKLKNEEIRLAMEENIAVYALYYTYRHFIQLDNITLNKLKMRNQEFNKMIVPSMRNINFIERIYSIIERLKQEKTITKASQLAVRIIELAIYKPGWSSFLYDANLMGHTSNQQGMAVKIGCDLRGLKIFERNKVTPLYQFKLEESNWSVSINALELNIKQDNDTEFKLMGRDLWKIKHQFNFYKLYRQEFLLKK